MGKWDPSKWEIHQLYADHSKLRELFPSTQVLSQQSLSKFLHKYDSIYVKGIHEHKGSGIIKAWRTREGYRYVRVKGEPRNVRSIDKLYDKVKDGRSRKSVLVQQTIDLAQIYGRPHSIRLMLMRDGRRMWRYAGMKVKVAGKSSVVTNRGGGYHMTIEEALARSLNYGKNRIKRVKKELIDQGFELIQYAVKRGYRTYEAGIDMGIDRRGNIWVIEVNFAYPSYKMFDRLKDKKYYRRILRLAAEYRNR